MQMTWTVMVFGKLRGFDFLAVVEFGLKTKLSILESLSRIYQIFVDPIMNSIKTKFLKKIDWEGGESRS